MDLSVSVLVGQTLKTVTATDEEVIFVTTGGDSYKLYHEQDCCESVTLQDVTGDILDLVDTPILHAEEVDSDAGPLEVYESSYTWTFYKLATVKGWVTLRWYGTSNGYYSERVSFAKMR